MGSATVAMPMALHADDVDALARLARLTLDEDERDTLVRQLGDIVHYIDVLSSAQVEEIAPWQPPAPTCTPLRADIAGASLPAEEILRGAPAVADGLVIVPRFVES